MTTQTKSGSSLQGALSAEALVRILGTLYAERHTGVLHLSRGSEHLTLRFVHGHVVSGGQGPSGRLGEILVRCGRLETEDLDLALEKATLEGRRLGPVLVEDHLTSREAVQEALRLQVRDVLFAALFWGFGSYRFEADAGPTLDEEISLEISTVGLLFDLVSALEAPGAVLRGLIDPSTPVLAAPDAVARLRSGGGPLSPVDAYVLSRADGVMAIREIVEAAPLPPANVDRSLLALWSCGALVSLTRRVDPDETVALSREELGPGPGRLIALRKLELEQTLRSFTGQSHFEVLGVEPAASADEVKRAYLRLVREYHPDTAREPVLAEATKAVFLRISEAYNVLGSVDTRKHHEERLRAAASRDQPSSAEAHPLPEPAAALWQAEALLGAGKPFEAVALLEDVWPHLPGPLRRSARLVRARAYLRTPSGSRSAEAELLDLLREDPGCFDACLMLGRLYRDQGLNRRAAKQFARALEIVPGQPEATAALRTLPIGDRGTSRLRLAFAAR